MSRWLKAHALAIGQWTSDLVEEFLLGRRRPTARCTPVGRCAHCWNSWPEGDLLPVEDPTPIYVVTADCERYLPTEPRLVFHARWQYKVARAHRFSAGYGPAGGTAALTPAETTRALLDQGEDHSGVVGEAAGCDPAGYRTPRDSLATASLVRGWQGTQARGLAVGTGQQRRRAE